MNITLFGKRVFADILKDLKMRSFWILWVGPKSSDKYPYRRLSEEREMEKSPCADGGRDWNEAATSQGMPAAMQAWRCEEGLSSHGPGGS